MSIQAAVLTSFKHTDFWKEAIHIVSFSVNRLKFIARDQRTAKFHGTGINVSVVEFLYF